MHWATAIQPTRVLGLTLREPVTLAHVLLLAEIESPVIAGGLVTIGDIALAAFILTMVVAVVRGRASKPPSVRAGPRG